MNKSIKRIPENKKPHFYIYCTARLLNLSEAEVSENYMEAVSEVKKECYKRAFRRGINL